MAVLQYLLGNLRFELIEGLYIMAPASFGFLVLGIMAFEWEALRVEDGLGKITRTRTSTRRRRFWDSSSTSSPSA